MNFGRAILALGAPRTFAEAIGELRGRGSQWLAGHLGIPARTARYYLSGAREPNPRTAVGRQRRQAVMDAVDRAGRLRIAARALRQARTLSVGRVKVATKSKDKPDGSRSIGTVLVDGEARSERIEPPSSLEEVADMLIADPPDIGGAEAAFSECILGLYAVSRTPPQNRDSARAHIYVYDYPSGIQAG
ncbi:MAG: hypothetical protein E6J90_36740 [Deltaproteobacteria bacterium]|nr:MAG: hypothetical protein E6J90_36740 [Deltaproteobacteria bacterium]